MTRSSAPGVRTASTLTAGTLLVAALLAGCGGAQAPASTSSTAVAQPSADGPPSPWSTPQPTDGTAPSEDQGATAPADSSAPSDSSTEPTLSVHAHVVDGQVVLGHESTTGLETLVSAPDSDTGVVLTLTLPDASSTVSLDVPDTSGGSSQGQADGSAAVVRADGALLLGVAAPSATASDGTQPGARWVPTVDGGPSLALDLGGVDPSAFPLEVTVHLGASVVASTSWGDREGGRSLTVTPTDWGRVSGATGSVFAWGDLLATDPSADTPGMEKQLQCHLLGARDKATWNLEPWRPDVSLVDYALARCNPT